MPDRPKKKKSSPDLSEMASGIASAATQDVELTIEQAKDAAHAAVAALERLGGLQGGRARESKTSPVARRQRGAKKAATTRPRRRPKK